MSACLLYLYCPELKLVYGWKLSCFRNWNYFCCKDVRRWINVTKTYEWVTGLKKVKSFKIKVFFFLKKFICHRMKKSYEVITRILASVWYCLHWWKCRPDEPDLVRKELRWVGTRRWSFVKLGKKLEDLTVSAMLGLLEGEKQHMVLFTHHYNWCVIK